MTEKLKEHPDRLIFIGDTNAKKQLDPNSEALNAEILSKEPNATNYNPNGKSWREFNKNEIISKFLNYEEIPSKDYAGVVPTNKWFRVLKKDGRKWTFRSGGFIIHNDTEDRYFVFKNREQNFTWTFQYDEILLFGSLGKNQMVYPNECSKFLSNHFSKPAKKDGKAKKSFIAFRIDEDNKGELFHSSNLKGLHTQLPNDKFKPRNQRSIGNLISSKKYRSKGYWFNRTYQDFTNIQEDFEKVDDCETLNNKAIKKRLKELLRR